MDDVTRVSEKLCGKGGYKCRCCGPSPASRKSHRRLVRHIANQGVKKLIEEETKAADSHTAGESESVGKK